MDHDETDTLLEELRELLELQRVNQDRTERVVARLMEELDRERVDRVEHGQG
jgi:hypothetical protein